MVVQHPLKVLSQSVNASCAERCLSTYSYIHCKEEQIEYDRAENLVLVHYNHRLLSRYREDCDQFKIWDANPEEANIEEDITTLEKGEKPDKRQDAKRKMIFCSGC
ncbi:hypothetical protein U1Q18_052546 [Sarracenia purpurea var. burkii]